MTLTAKLRALIDATYTKSRDLANTEYEINAGAEKYLASGTGNGQVGLMFDDQRTIAASSNEELDLAGSLTDAFGDTLTFATVKVILVKAATTNTNNVIVGGAGSNAFVGPFGDASDTVAVKPGGWAYFLAPNTGWTVTAGTGDKLKIANSSSGSAVVYDILILGTA